MQRDYENKEEMQNNIKKAMSEFEIIEIDGIKMRKSKVGIGTVYQYGCITAAETLKFPSDFYTGVPAIDIEKRVAYSLKDQVEREILHAVTQTEAFKHHMTDLKRDLELIMLRNNTQQTIQAAINDLFATKYQVCIRVNM